jgi:DNA invertase Pin-like site-specific DNA recombinase
LSAREVFSRPHRVPNVRAGWEIWKVYEDAGISGAKDRDKRPGLEAMMKAVNAKRFDLVATWSGDRRRCI